MGITITVERYATPTTTGEVTWTDTNLGGLTPKAIMVIQNHADTDGTVEAGLVQAMGMADATREGSLSSSSLDNVTTTNTDTGSANSDVINVFVDTTKDVTARFVSFQADSVTLDFTTVDSDAQLYTVVFFAGTDLSVYAELVRATTGGLNITGPGFEPDLILASNIHRGNAADGPQADLIMSFGACLNDGSATSRSVGQSSRTGVTTSVVNSQLVTDAISVGMFSDAAHHKLTVSDFDANGFTITSNSGTRNFLFLALNFGGVASASVRSFDSPTATGNDARTGVGFKPQFVMLGMTDAQAEDTIETDADAGGFGISVFTADKEFSNSWADEDAQTTTDTQSLADDQAINFASGDGVTQHAATFVSMDSDGHTLNYSTADGTARKWFEVAIAEVSAAAAAPQGHTHIELVI